MTRKGSTFYRLRKASREAVAAFEAWLHDTDGDIRYHAALCAAMDTLRKTVEVLGKKPTDLGWCKPFHLYDKYQGPRHYHRATGRTLCGRETRHVLERVDPQPDDRSDKHCGQCKHQLTWHRP